MESAGTSEGHQSGISRVGALLNRYGPDALVMCASTTSTIPSAAW